MRWISSDAWCVFGSTATVPAGPSIFSPVSIEPSGGSISIAFDEVELSSGRCAGPRMLDLANGLPRGSIRAAALRRHGRVLDLSSDTRFAAGPFSGSVRSTVRIAFTRLRARRDRFASAIHFVRSKRYRRYAGVELDYRIASVAGAVTTDFRGVPGAACAALGACGATGSSAYSIAGARGDISLIATRRLRKGQRPLSFRKGLRALRRGKLPLLTFAELSRGRVTVAERFASPAGACSDSLFAEAPGVDVLRREGSLALAFRSSGGLGEDSLRTRCPGPAEQDAIGNGSIALGKIGLAALGQRRLRVAATSARSFARGGYAGQRQGQLDVSLELEWAGTVTGIG